jgi:hypothetical protein
MFRLGVALSALGEDEHRLLLGIAERLVMGRGIYGPLALASDPRDWRTEQKDELLDFLVYREAHRLSQTTSAPPGPPPGDDAPRLVGSDRDG